jgi:linoleoyl-CoA desaturase
VTVTATKLTFPTDSAFQRDLRARVDAYFADNHLSKTATPFMWAKTAFWLGLAFGSLFTAQYAPLPGPVSLLFWMLAGAGFAGVGFNVSHDAIHGATSTDKGVNDLFSWTFDAIGAASSTWRIAHNLLHHTYTNVPLTDTDIEPGPALRFEPYAKHYPWQRVQAVYAWFLYMLTSALWVYHKDFQQALRRHPRSGERTSAREWAKIFVGKSIHVSVFVVLPLYFSPHATTTVLVGYALFHAVAGFMLAVVFQLAHVVEGVRYIRPDDNGRFPRGWMEHELLTTANFGGSKLCTFITGGLDHQIEHHLFPLICHVHYPALSPIVEQCAKDHGLPYLHSGSFLQAVASHARMLHRLGTAGDAVADVAAIAAPVARDVAPFTPPTRPVLAATA